MYAFSPTTMNRGVEYARRIADTLHSIAGSVRIVDLPGGWKDVSEWLEQGNIGETLAALADEAPEWSPYTSTDDRVAETLSPLGELDAGDDIDVLPPRGWLLGNVFCRKFLSSVLGDGGVGKTALRYAQYISLAINRSLTGEHVFRRSRVLIISLEDDLDELRRRIRAARIHHAVSQEELKGWLFYAAPGGAAGKLMTADKAGRAVKGELANHIRQTIIKRNIDLVAIDPFVKNDSVEENQNSIIDDVAQVLTDLAAEHDIAIDAPHHVSKGAPEPGNANRGRGASSMVDAARLVTTLTPMSSQEAKLFNIAEDCRSDYVRLDNGKVNIIRRGGNPKWFRLFGVRLGNGTELYPNGDEVQTVEPWKPPEIWAGLSGALLNQMLDKIAEGLPDGSRYSHAPNAKERGAWQVIIDIAPATTEQQAREIIRQWIKNGVLVSENYKNPVTHKDAKGLGVDHTKRPTA